MPPYAASIGNSRREATQKDPPWQANRSTFALPVFPAAASQDSDRYLSSTANIVREDVTYMVEQWPHAQQHRLVLMRKAVRKDLLGNNAAIFGGTMQAPNSHCRHLIDTLLQVQNLKKRT